MCKTKIILVEEEEEEEEEARCRVACGRAASGEPRVALTAGISDWAFEQVNRFSIFIFVPIPGKGSSW